MFYLIPVPSDKSIDDNQAFYVFALGLINLIRSQKVKSMINKIKK